MMEEKNLKVLITEYGNQETALNKLVVTAFVRNCGITVVDDFLRGLIIEENDSLYEDLSLLSSLDSLEDIIHIFELAIPREDVIENGAVYTPKYIRDAILKGCLERIDKNIEDCYCADISCGCGAFIYTAAKYVKAHSSLMYDEILSKFYGIDISRCSIERAKIVLSLMAASEGETIDTNSLHLYVYNTLDFDFTKIYGSFNGFDLIVGNPPYVRAKHIDPDTKELMKKWEVSRCGNSDLYITFLQIGIEQLSDNGVMGVITVNSFFKSVNARGLRKYLSSHNIGLSIVNFGEELVFKGKMAYTCLAFATKQKSEIINYVRTSSENVRDDKPLTWNVIKYTALDDHRGWNLSSREVMDNIAKIESTGIPLGKLCNIRNGIATLANDIFIFRPVSEDYGYYYFKSSDKELTKVEKSICKDIIKPNILKSENDIKDKLEKIIFPYDSAYELIEEEIFKNKYPFAYKYILSNKSRLMMRDKGEAGYPWYAFGRTQAINYVGKKLMFPYIADHPHFVYSNNEEMLIYCGYAIYDDSDTRLAVLKKILESSTFDYYMRHTSKPYATGYYSYAKNYVKNFGVCQLNSYECSQLLSMNDKREIDTFVAAKYGLKLETPSVYLITHREKASNKVVGAVTR